ncbi:hypothetical protein D5086_007272, partial [Populus alba]
RKKKMQNQEGQLAADGETEVTCEIEDWANFGGGDDDVTQQQSSVPFVGDKEPLSALAAEYQSGSPILLQKIKVLGDKYVAIRRTRGDGNCFFRSFMFSYLEHILEKQDRAEVDRIKANVEECRKTLQSLGYVDFTFEDFFALFLEQLDDVLQGNETSISHEELLNRSRDQSVSDYGELLDKVMVEPMGEESDHVHITALSDALGVPIRVVYLDRSSCDAGGVSVNHHDFVPAPRNLPSATGAGSESINPFITLLYRPGHYDILYPK